MTSSDVTKEGLRHVRPGREAVPGSGSSSIPVAPAVTRGRDGGRGERPMVPAAEFRSYYGLPVLNPPTWKAPDIGGYLFLGGLAGAGSALAAGFHLTGRRAAADRMKVGAAAAIGLGAVGLVHDLGRPERFVNMLRVWKPTSPMSMGSWLLSVYGPLAGAAAGSAVTGRWPRVGAVATAGAALTGPAVAAYTGALIADTAVPAWHDGHREMPYVFVGSAATAAAGLGLVVASLADNAPARRLAFLGAAVELAAAKRMEWREGMVAEPYQHGKGGAFMRAGEVLTGVGIVAGVGLGGRSRLAAAVGGGALLAASACTRLGIFHAGVESATDPRYTIEPQRERMRTR